MESIRRIAVFSCSTCHDNQSRTIHGILKAAKEIGSKVFIFTCHINADADRVTREGAYNICNLPDLARFDGVILAKGSFFDTEIVEQLIDRTRALRIPAVSIDEPITGMGNVKASNYECEKALVEHLITEHNAKDSYYILGRMNNKDSEERFMGFKDALRAQQIPYKEEQVYQGDYTIESGNHAADWILKERNGKEMPDAIICANDAMALGVMETLKKRGYQIPKDVIVTGFDHDDGTQVFEPSLTTIDKKQEEIGYLAVKEIISQKNGNKPKTIEVHSKIVLGESCGCGEKNNKKARRIYNQYVTDKIANDHAVTKMRSMTASFTSATSRAEFYDIIRQTMILKDMSAYYMCICDEKKIFRDIQEHRPVDMEKVNTHFTKYVTIPVGYEHGKQIQHKEFLAGEILPEELIERDHSSFYLIVPIFYGNLCFGYGVVGDSKIALHQEIFYSWTTSIGNGMENLRKWQLMNGMMERLNQVWLYDNLTQIYNRSGFFNQAEALLAKIQRKNSGICLIFIDMDGLKKVNDTYGHEEGDNYICAMAKILKHIQKEEDLIMRYGGDEFVYMGESLSEKEAENRKKEVRNYIHTYNEKKAQETPLRASIGIIFQKAEEVQDLKALIHQADQKMYIEKKKKNDLTSGLIRL